MSETRQDIFERVMRTNANSCLVGYERANVYLSRGRGHTRRGIATTGIKRRRVPTRNTDVADGRDALAFRFLARPRPPPPTTPRASHSRQRSIRFPLARFSIDPEDRVPCHNYLPPSSPGSVLLSAYRRGQSAQAHAACRLHFSINYTTVLDAL